MIEANVYIHVGLHRTASTFLQVKYFPMVPNSNYISQLDIVEELVAITTTSEFLWQTTDVKNNTVKSLSKKINAEKINILSAEALSGFPFLKSINRSLIFERLYEIFPNAKLILGIRAQDKLLQSYYSLYIREGGTLKFEELLNNQKRGFFGYTIYDSLIETLDLDTLKYNLIIKELNGLFGVKNVHVFLLEELQESERAIERLSDFLNVEVLINREEKVNAKFPLNALRVIRVLNVLTRGFKSKSKFRNFQKSYLNRLLVKIFRKFDKNKPLRLDVDIRAYFLEANKDLSDMLPAYKSYINNFNKNKP